MINFYSDSPETRKAHPQGSLIPDHIWEEFFSDYLSEWQIKLMQESISSIMTLDIPRNISRIRSWICVVVSHQEAEASDLIAFAKKLGLKDSDLLRAASSLGHMPVISLLLSQHSSEVKTALIAKSNYACFIRACELGNIDIVNLLLSSVDPLKKQEMLAAGYPNYSGFTAACCSSLALVKKILEEVEISARSKMLSADNFAGLREACFSKHVELINLLLNYPECLAFVAKKIINREGGRYELSFQIFIKQMVKSLKREGQCLDYSEELWVLILKSMIKLHRTNLMHDFPVMLNIEQVKKYITQPEGFEDIYTLACATDNLYLILLVLIVTNQLEHHIDKLAQNKIQSISTLQDRAIRIRQALEKDSAWNTNKFFINNADNSVVETSQAPSTVKVFKK